MQRLVEFGYPVENLIQQHRMHDAIASFPGRFFYHDGTLVRHANIDRLPTDGHSLSPYVFYDLVGLEERELDGGICNTTQAAFVLELLQLCKGHPAATAHGIGVVSFSQRQVEILSEAIPPEFSTLVEVCTVDRLQGREKGIIILVTVRSNARGSIDPLDDDRRFNLAITRAKEVLWIVGNSHTLSKGSSKA